MLRYCQAVARLGSFTKAADEIHIAQPAMSMAVAKLEDELGAKLFFRVPRGVTPTPEGELLLARAARIFAELDSARREIQDASDMSTGVVRVGFPPMYGLHYFPQLLMGFHKKYPGIEISAQEGSATEVRDMLNAGEIDIGMLESRRVDRSWGSVIVGTDEMVLGVCDSHPLAGQTKVSARALDGLDMVVLSRSFLQRQLFDEFCESHGVKYRTIMECNFVHMTVLAAQKNHGAATLLASLVKTLPGLTALSFQPRFEFNFELCWRKDRYLSKANQALVEFAISHPLDSRSGSR